MVTSLFVAPPSLRLSFGQPGPWLLARLAELKGESTEPFAARQFGGTVSRAINS